MNNFIRTNKYFSNYRDEILDIVKPLDDEIKYISNKYGDLTTTIFIHVRMGDYIGDPLHFLNLQNYYTKCIDLCTNSTTNTQMIVVTDDKDKCLELYPFLSVYQIVIEPEIMTLFIMSLCLAGGICANSSFSWWGAWLNKNPNKKIFMPNKWFGDPAIETSDIYFDNVNIIPI